MRCWCHGFTGTPQSLRGWAQYLADAGLSVELPRLPGHGTTVAEANLTHWEDWYAEIERHLALLRERCDEVFVMGLSMGGTLAIRLAEEHGDEIAGLVLVNPSLLTKRPDRFLLPVLRLVVPPGPASPATSRSRAQPSWPTTASRSRPPTSSASSGCTPGPTWPRSPSRCWCCARPRTTWSSRTAPGCCSRRSSSTDVREILLEDSYHVATLDNDAPVIFENSLEFVRRLTRTSP